jgi:8-oxo-dGTP pyrophosphatase MutT (NUDIX family)
MSQDFLRRVERLFKPVEAWGEFRRGARPAAVAFVLYEQAGAWTVPFVRRRADLRDHPGQVALPGGSVEPGEPAWTAAQREVAEEIGVSVGRLVPLGAGDPIYAAVSNFSVVPFVAHLPDPVESFVYDVRELEGVLAIPLERLLDDTAWKLPGAFAISPTRRASCGA